MTLDEARHRIGSGVVYDPGHGPREDGTIVGVSDRYVFVQYAGALATAKATPAERLTLLSGAVSG